MKSKVNKGPSATTDTVYIIYMAMQISLFIIWTTYHCLCCGEVDTYDIIIIIDL